MLGVTFRLFASIYSRMINNDNIIIQRIRSGETWEFGLLVNSYGSALMAFVGRIVDQQEDAEDIVQNTFVAAYEHLKDYDPQRASLTTWLQRIAYHEALCYLRKRKRQVLLPLEVGADVPDELPETTSAEQLDEAIQPHSMVNSKHIMRFNYLFNISLSMRLSPLSCTCSRDCISVCS